MKIKFIKGKRSGEVREVKPAMFDYFVNIRQEAVKYTEKVVEPEIKKKVIEPKSKKK
jgi:hypothetical protein